MRSSPAIARLIFLVAVFPFISNAQQSEWEVQALNQIIPDAPQGHVEYDLASGTAHGTNGVFVKYGGTTLTADNASLNWQTGGPCRPITGPSITAMR